MTLLIATVFCSLILSVITSPIGNKTEHAIIVDTLNISTLWAGHPVNFALLTQPPIQFIAYYDAERQLTVAQRNLNERAWITTKLPVTTDWDSHKYIVMAIDDDSYVHLCANLHVTPLIYFRTTQPRNLSTFTRQAKMVDPDEDRTTYPIFFRGPKNEFIFTNREGMSGNGNQIYNIYDLKAKTWYRLLDKPLTNGEGKRNAYFYGPILGPDGYFHLAWVWRESPDCSSNHDLSYARSKDLVSWETSTGKSLELPITLETCEIVDPVPQNGGIINGNAKVGFDQQDRVTISYHKNDANNYTQPYTARLENGVWRKYQITNWPWHWNFSGGGTITFDIDLGPLVKENDGSLTQSYSHIIFGNGTWSIDPQTLAATGTLQRQRIPPSLQKVEGTFPGLRVDFQEDSGQNTVNDTRYILRWETLGPNRDQPRPPPYPPPSQLRAYAIKVFFNDTVLSP